MLYKLIAVALEVTIVAFRTVDDIKRKIHTDYPRMRGDH